MKRKRSLTRSIRSGPGSKGSGPPWSSRDEPNWLEAGTVSRLLNVLGCQNEATFNAAVSLGGSVHQDLITYRNYIAHHNRGTALKVRALARARRASPMLDPLELPLQLSHRKPYCLLVEWLSDIHTMMALVPE